MRVHPAQLAVTLRSAAFVASRTAFLLCACCSLPRSSSGAEPNQARFAAPQAAAMQLTTPVRVPVPPARPGMDLAALEQVALANNPSIARTAALVGAARGNWIQVGLKPNPSVGYEGQQLGSGGLAEQQGVTVSQEFVREASSAGIAPWPPTKSARPNSNLLRKRSEC